MPTAQMAASKSPSLLPSTSCQFTPIQEEAEESSHGHDRIRTRSTPTPILHKKKRSDDEDGSVSCNNCRPHSLPFDHNNNNSSSLASPNNSIFRSLLSKLTRKSPMSSSSQFHPPEEHWKMVVAELSHKLLQATRKRDDALLEASRLMQSMADLEKKLNKLELYCHTLKSGLEQCTNSSKAPSPFPFQLQHDTLIQHFLVSVSEARSCVRLLSRSLTMQLRHMGTGTKVYHKLSFLLQPYDIKMSLSKSPRSLLLYLEALLNAAFFEDFETIGFQKKGCNTILNPMEGCERNYGRFKMLKGVTWEEVVRKGTRHFSQELSRFCDRKMSEIVGMLGWNRAWPEPLLQAFFGASKSVWMVHLLANSVHPSLGIFRVDKGVEFDSVYMEMEDHISRHSPSNLLPSLVRIMLAPGFYVFGSAVKCKVLCSYFTTNNQHPPLTPTP